MHATLRFGGPPSRNNRRQARKLVFAGHLDLIVENSDVNGHPTLPQFGLDSWEAVDQFLATHSEFTPDPTREKFLLTCNPRGYLKRTR